MANEVLIANQQHYKELNNNQITFCKQRIADNSQQITSYGEAQAECEQNIKNFQEEIVKLEASNLAIDETINILETA